MTAIRNPAITVFSGGQAANSIVDVFNYIVERRRCQLNYVMPVSDNGGSSSELIRFVGGPSVGDIRSRLVRLIPSLVTSEQRPALKTLFEYRLPADPLRARVEWLDIVEARHPLWASISSPTRDLIRSVLNTLNLELVKRTRPGSSFDFSLASVGNMFMTGGRLFTGSLEAAIYLLAIICQIPDSVNVYPAINTNFTHHISAGLVDGSVIVGQCTISHPSAPTALPDDSGLTNNSGATYHPVHEIEDASLPGSLPVLRKPRTTFEKFEEESLSARIEKIWYINPYGHKITPEANPKVIAALRRSDTVIYSIGSLFTSIVASLLPRGIGAAIMASNVRRRILILNGWLDRETGPMSTPLTASDFIDVIVRACEESGDGDDSMAAVRTAMASTSLASDTLRTAGSGAGAESEGERTGKDGSKEGGAEADEAEVGVNEEVEVEDEDDEDDEDAKITREKAESLRKYVTHLVYLEGDPEGGPPEKIVGRPEVDVKGLRRLGISCVGVAGRLVARPGGRAVVLRYDEEDLGIALEAIMDG